MLEPRLSTERIPLPRLIANRLKERIESGGYPADSFLPGERDLAAELQVSRRTIAKALELLCEWGIVVRSQGRGTQVTNPAIRNTHKAVAMLAVESNPIWPEYLGIVRGIREVVERVGHPLNEHRAAEFAAEIDEVAGWAGGFVFVEAASDLHTAAAAEFERRRIPVVIANLEGRADLPISATCVNHHDVGLNATRLLLDLGHRRIAFVGNDPDRYFYGQARSGYLTALRHAGIPVIDNYIVTDSRPMVLAGYLATLRLLDLPQPPTAVFAARDGYGEGAIQAVRERGLIVGRDISIVGYDDLSHSPEDPVITTFREPVRELGAVAAEMVIERMSHGWKPVEHREIPANLVMRRSAGPFFPPAHPVPVRPPATDVAPAANPST